MINFGRSRNVSYHQDDSMLSNTNVRKKRQNNITILLGLIIVMIIFRIIFETTKCHCANTPTIIAMIFLVALISLTIAMVMIWHVRCRKRSIQFRSYEDGNDFDDTDQNPLIFST